MPTRCTSRLSTPCVLDGNERIVAVDVHAQIDAGVGYLGAHVAQADDADALALELAAHRNGLLGLLGIDLDLGSSALSRTQFIDCTTPRLESTSMPRTSSLTALLLAPGETDFAHFMANFTFYAIFSAVVPTALPSSCLWARPLR